MADPVADPRRATARGAAGRRDRSEDTVAALSDALWAEPDRPELWGRLATALLAAGRPADALRAAGEVIRLVPHDAGGHRLASQALDRLGRPAEALEAAHAAVRLASSEGLAHAQLARALAGVDRPREGWVAASRAVGLAPDEPAAHLAIAVVAEALADPGQARTAYRHALTLDPADAEARAALGRLSGRPPDPGPGEGTGGRSGRAAVDPWAAWRIGLTRILRGQWLLGIACYAGLAYDRTAPYTAGALTGVAVVLGASGWLRWQAQPAAVRAFARRLPRTDRRARALVLLALGGAAALVAVVPAAMLGSLAAARVAVVASVAATTTASMLLGRAVRPGSTAAPAGWGAA